MSIRVLFVCLGNICRSPMAEAVFQQLVQEAGLEEQIEVASAGTGAWHVGEPPHQGTRRLLAQQKIAYEGRAQQIQANDIREDTYIIAMDADNESDLRHRFGDHPRLYRLLEFASDTDVRDVPDPYYTGNFDYVYELVLDGCRGLLDYIRQAQQL